jgi:dihydrofolate reductase
MRKIVVHMQTTLDGRISNTAGFFWEPLVFGDPETLFVNDAFRSADTWAMGRGVYQFVVPYWEQVAAGSPPEIGGPIRPARQEFADLLVGLTKIVFSITMNDDPGTRRVVISGDIAAQLADLKNQPGKRHRALCRPRNSRAASKQPRPGRRVPPPGPPRRPRRRPSAVRPPDP